MRNGEDQKLAQRASSAGVGWIHLSFPCIDPVNLTIGRFSHIAVEIKRRNNKPHVTI
jgi:hypothetical protein